MKHLNYKEIIRAVKQVAGFDDNTKMYAAPKLARKLGGHISKRATNVLLKSIEENDKYLMERVEQFIKLHKMNYNIEVGAQAQRNKMKNQRNKTKLLPLSNDVMKLTTYVTEVMNKNIEILK